MRHGDEHVHNLVRSALTELADEARPMDLFPVALRRTRRRAVSLSLDAVTAAAALLIGLPVTVALAGSGAGDGHSTPASSPSLSLSGTPADPSTIATSWVPGR